MHILFVTPSLPVPISSGRTRAFNLIKQLSVRHDVSVISFMQPSERVALKELAPFCKRLELLPLDEFTHPSPWRNRVLGWWLLLASSRPRYIWTYPIDRIRELYRSIVEEVKPDVLHFEQLYLAELYSMTPQIPAVLGEQNVEFEIIRKQLRVASDPVRMVRDYLTWKKMRAYEIRWLRRFPVCLAVSEEDARILEDIVSNTSIYLVPNGVDCAQFATGSTEIMRDPATIIFFGTLNYSPNREGIIYFCKHVWPRVYGRRPDAILKIIGRDSPPDVMALGVLPGVEYVGFVPDIRAVLWKATLSIAPIVWGGGTRLKILEAVAAGCPVVSTTMGAEGLRLRDQEEIILADSPDDFSNAILELLERPAKRSAIAVAARQSVADNYDWSAIVRELEAAYAKATAH